MKKYEKKKKQSITLLEIMIVIFLIGLIGSVVGYNVKGSLDKGKAFKTTQGAQQIEEILLLELSEGADPTDVQNNIESYLEHSGFCKDPKNLLKDGWGGPYTIQISAKGEVAVTSEKLDEYKSKNDKSITPAKAKTPKKAS